jgi:SAM-dependent methyltransferase
MILTLKSEQELHASRAELAARGLDFSDPARVRLWRLLYHARFRTPLPPADPMKSWDVAEALKVIEQAVPNRATPILDMGCFNSEVIYALHVLGYKSIHGCDLNPLCRWMPYWHAVRYSRADLTATPYPAGSFGAITCLSVIEHGVPLDAMAAEVDRLLRPGGVFIFTTDFDATGSIHEIDPKFRVFGQSWQVFTPDGLSEVVDGFRSRGFELVDPTKVDLVHDLRPVRWKGQEYTFVLVAIRKSGTGEQGQAA